MNLWEEMFLITWFGENVSLREAQGMHVQYRKWWLERIAKQKRKEAESANKRRPTARPSIRPHRRR